MTAAMSSVLPTQPGFIVLSEEERKAGRWSRANLQKALELLHRDGLLGMTGIVDAEHLKAIREVMLKTAQEIRSSKTELTDFNHGIATNFLQSPPLTDPELQFEDIYANRFVHQIVEGYLGPDISMGFITANTALAHTTQRQPVHKDAPFLHPMAPYGLNTNFPLSDFTSANGSTEFWLGTHNQTSAGEQLWRSKESISPTCDVAPSYIEARNKVRPGAQLEVPFGSVLLRDMRTWHAGMPNTTAEDRIMLACGYQASWYPASPVEKQYKAPLSMKPLLTSNPRVGTAFRFVPDEEWLEICQNWGVGPGNHAIQLPIAPGTFLPAGEQIEWTSLNGCSNEDKIVNPAPNMAALG